MNGSSPRCTHSSRGDAVARELFGIYSWVTSLLWGLMNLLPPVLRSLVFRLVLKRCGREVYIDYRTYIRYASRVSVGSYTWINRGCRFFASHYNKDVEIRIGEHVAIAPECCFLAAGHDYHDRTLPDTAATITVGDYVWIGARSTVLPGVTIGEGAVIGANSVVTHDIPPWSVAVGSPARVIKERVLNE